jgi:lipoprotein-anchoring transpeptidase ErfK/SrfK
LTRRLRGRYTPCGANAPYESAAEGCSIRTGKLVYFVFGIVLLLSIGGGVLFFRSLRQPSPPTKPSEPFATPVEPARPTPAFEPFPQKDLPPLTERVERDRRWIRIVKSRYTLLLYRGTEVERSYPIAVGKNGGNKTRSGDNRTPEGRFSVDRVQDASSWTHDFGDGKGPIRGAYGPWFIRLKTGWQGIGIHGTHDPLSIGGRVSEGCIRMRNQDVSDLRARVAPGMLVVIED